MNVWLIGSLGLVGTLIVYLFAQKIHFKYRKVYTSPMIIGTPIIILVLLLFNIPYNTYSIGGNVISMLLGPAVVALAYPLYMQRNTLRKYAIPIIGGSLVGSVTGVFTGIIIAKWMGIDKEVILSLIPKSVTTPVAMEVATSVGGSASLAAIFVVTAGVGGILMSSVVMDRLNIKNPIAYGVGVGSASHAIGTAVAMEKGLLEGSISTISMIVCATFVSIMTPLFIQLLM